MHLTAEIARDTQWLASSARLCVRVTDSGPGLTAAQCERLFDDFECVGDEPGITGIGLGRAISRRLARAMGRDLAVTSGRGAGCCFVVTLPVKAACQDPLCLTAASRRPCVSST